jgi:hypothetical protein
MSNLAIPAADQADVAQREEGQLVVGGGRGAEGAYNISE